MSKNELKLFVGGYHDARIFKGEKFEDKTPFDKNINTYTLEEALKLPYIENVTEWYKQNGKEWYKKEFGKECIEDEILGIDFDDLTEQEK